MPPCKRVLLNKIKRTNAITRMLKQSALNDTYLPKLSEGWALNSDGEFCTQYLEGELFPSDILDLEISGEDSDMDECNCESDLEEEEECPL